MGEKPLVHGPQMPGGAADPVGERRAIERDPLPGVDLRLTIERQVIGVFGDEHMGDRRLGRQAALDQPRRGRRLHDDVLAGAAGVFGTAHHQHAELRRHDVEPLGDVLADPVQHALAAGAGLVLDIDDGLDARQMRRAARRDSCGASWPLRRAQPEIWLPRRRRCRLPSARPLRAPAASGLPAASRRGDRSDDAASP